MSGYLTGPGREPETVTFARTLDRVTAAADQARITGILTIRGICRRKGGAIPSMLGDDLRRAGPRVGSKGPVKVIRQELIACCTTSFWISRQFMVALSGKHQNLEFEPESAQYTVILSAVHVLSLIVQEGHDPLWQHGLNARGQITPIIDAQSRG